MFEKLLSYQKEIKHNLLTQKEQAILFIEIWEKYPNRDGKKKAIQYFIKTVKTQEDWDKINIALKNYIDSARVKKGFIKNGSTWFNNWEDWVEYTEELCVKCKGRGIVIGETSDFYCNCSAGVRARAEGK